MDRGAAGRLGPGTGLGGGGDEAVPVDLGADQDDVLGVDQPGRAGGGDRVPGGVGGRAARGGGAGDDGEDPAGPQQPLAGGVQQPGVRAGRLLAAAAGAVAAGDGQPGRPGSRVAGGRQRRRAGGPLPVRGSAGGESEDAPPGGRGGLGDRRRAGGYGDQVAGGGERLDDPPGGCGGDRPPAREAVPGAVRCWQAGPDAQRDAWACPGGGVVSGRCGVRAGPAARPSRSPLKGCVMAAGPACRRFLR